MNNGFFPFTRLIQAPKITSAALAANVSRNGAYYNIGLTVDIYTYIQDEAILCCLSGYLTHAATHSSYWKWYVDEADFLSPALIMGGSATAGYAMNLVATTPLTIPGVGKHTITLMVYSDNTTVYYAGSRIDIMQFPSR